MQIKEIKNKIHIFLKKEALVLKVQNDSDQFEQGTLPQFPFLPRGEGKSILQHERWL